MAPFKDLTGRVFGRLTVVAEAGRDRHGRLTWLTRCECGTEKVIQSGNLTSGDTRSCGCLHRELTGQRRKLDLTGKRFGRLTVVREHPERRGGVVCWVCRCECDNETIVLRGNLLKGVSRSCGCLKREAAVARKLDHTGCRFGRLVALRVSERRGTLDELYWWCDCDCGRTVEVRAASLMKGTQSCGCLNSEVNSERSVIDRTGIRYGRLVVREQSGRNRHGQVLWLCDCDCGNEKSITSGELATGGTTSCGCLRHEYVDVAGQVFGRLTALRPTEARKGGAVAWMCQCQCGGTIEVSGDSLRQGDTRSCGCLSREVRPQTSREMHARRRTERQASNPLYGRLSRQQLLDRAFIEQPSRAVIFARDLGICHLCTEPVNPSDNAWHLDHILPLMQGGLHHPDNCAVSHPFCNVSKGDRLDRQPTDSAAWLRSAAFHESALAVEFLGRREAREAEAMARFRLLEIAGGDPDLAVLLAEADAEAATL